MEKITREDIEEFIEDCTDEDVLMFDDYLSAFIGLSVDGIAIYEYSKMIECLLDEGMDLSEAKDHLDNDTLKSITYMGEKAPIVMWSYE